MRPIGIKGRCGPSVPATRLPLKSCDARIQCIHGQFCFRTNRCMWPSETRRVSTNIRCLRKFTLSKSLDDLTFGAKALVQNSLGSVPAAYVWKMWLTDEVRAGPKTDQSFFMWGLMSQDWGYQHFRTVGVSLQDEDYVGRYQDGKSNLTSPILK